MAMTSSGGTARSTGSDSEAVLARLEGLHPKLIDLSLDRVERLLAALGNPHYALPPVIHVAGTNGKGSVVAFLKAILEAADQRVHTFISPHLVSFHERINLAAPGGAEPITERALVDVLQRAETANDGGPITYFEITTAAAFLAFSEAPADYLVLETGLGGRLDATNVVPHPALTVLTSISIDHTTFLGKTLDEIAGEKAGIMKTGVPCVVARQDPVALARIERRAQEVDAPLIAAGRDWDAYEQHGRLIYQTESALVDLPLPRLPGRHQIDNAGAAITAACALFRDTRLARALETGLSSVTWPGRLERLGPGRLLRHLADGAEIWLDGGHNPAAAETLARSMADLEERVPRPLHLVVGMMTTKDAAAFLRPFEGLVEWVGTIAVPGHDNSYGAAELADIARGEGLAAEAACDLPHALELSRARASGPVRILVCGSLYLAGHVLSLHRAQAGR